MKIAFDLRRIGNPGIGRYMKCLVKAVLMEGHRHEYVLLLPPHARDLFATSGDNVTALVPHSAYYSVTEQMELPRLLRKHRVDLLHSPHFLLPLVQACPAVVTIHDVIYLACAQDLNSRVGRLYYRAMMYTSARLAKKIITDSNFSKKEIVRYLGVKPDKISVIYPAVDENMRAADRFQIESVLRKYNIDDEYVFYTGIYKPRKNHAGLITAFQRFLALGGTGKLVIAGPLAEGAKHLHELANAAGIADRLILPGFIDDSELCALYSAARVYACASTYEGFGFTVLEAMACGIPVVTSDSASLPEVAGNAALYTNANDPSQFGEALYRACTDPSLRHYLVERGYRNVHRFNWADAANACLKTYEDVLNPDVAGAVAFTS